MDPPLTIPTKCYSESSEVETRNLAVLQRQTLSNPHVLPFPLGDAVAKIVDAYQSKGRLPFVACDFSPPRGASLNFLENARILDADFISVNYNPGRIPRAGSAMTAHAIRQHTGREVLFTLATRDMNPLALQSHLLGAATLGLENVLILGGDPFPTSRRRTDGAVGSMRPTELMGIVREMNSGLDRRGRPLEGATDFCVGGAVNLSANVDSEARLTHVKVRSGAQFFITQPVFDPHRITEFRSAYECSAGEPLSVPVFYGLQILRPNGVSFSPVPHHYQRQLEGGRSGEDIALEIWHGLADEGVDALYLVPPIGLRGIRDYKAAARFLQRVRT